MKEEKGLKIIRKKTQKEVAGGRIEKVEKAIIPSEVLSKAQLNEKRRQKAIRNLNVKTYDLENIICNLKKDKEDLIKDRNKIQIIIDLSKNNNIKNDELKKKLVELGLKILTLTNKIGESEMLMYLKANSHRFGTDEDGNEEFF